MAKKKSAKGNAPALFPEMDLPESIAPRPLPVNARPLFLPLGSRMDLRSPCCRSDN